ncbi:alpha/beta hydrolase [Rhodococcus sp. EPR-157]|uniref:alpha/beta hydrolase family protein n=1 Tax=Rhodococcus sp. EPR-157 TaxID=1813677 RepID=UPI0007BBCA03|nr:alpha/beta fold hydrolase [Rhodococcus sp. EPR-157]KZF05187.1 alpha/beta hydrolase [Rhodococcus sp. EPR-157]
MPDSTHEAAYVADGGVRGFLHLPDGNPVASLALTHGAGGNCTAKLLVDVATAWSARGIAVLRFDLAFRQARESGPPHPSKAPGDRDTVREAVTYLRDRGPGPVLVGGHSYGGRQASMAVSEDSDLAAGLLLLSYPLHPPGKPEKARTAHLPDIAIPTLSVSGTKDPFGTPTELREAIGLIQAGTSFIEITGAGHDLSAHKHHTAERSLEAAVTLFGIDVGTATTE